MLYLRTQWWSSLFESSILGSLFETPILEIYIWEFDSGTLYLIVEIVGILKLKSSILEFSILRVQYWDFAILGFQYKNDIFENSIVEFSIWELNIGDIYLKISI